MIFPVTKFEKHALMILGMASLGFAIGYFICGLVTNDTIFTICYFLSLGLCFGSMSWSVVNAYFLVADKNLGLIRKIFSMVLCLAPVLWTLTSLLWIEFGLNLSH